MIALAVDAGFADRLWDWVQGFRRLDVDLLARRLLPIVLDDVRRQRLAGMDASGAPMAPIKESTIERRRRAGKGEGPPLLPDDEASTLIAGARGSVNRLDPDRSEVVVDWPGAPWLIHHLTGVPSHNLPARDPVYISPEGRERLREEVRAFLQEQLEMGRLT